MKTLLLVLGIICVNFPILAQVGIGTTSPDASSILDLTTTDKGLLIPRLTTSDRNAIASPANGLMIYNTDSNEFQFNSNTPATPIWLAFSLTPTTTSSPGDSMKYNNTDTTTNLNVNTAIQLPVFGSIEWNDNGSLYSVTNNEVTLGETGRYKIKVNVSLDNSVARGAPEIRLTVNGAEIGSYGSTGYTRNNAGHTESSLHLNEVLEFTAGDVIAVNIVRSGNSGTMTMRSADSSNFYIEKVN